MESNLQSKKSSNESKEINLKSSNFEAASSQVAQQSFAQMPQSQLLNEYSSTIEYVEELMQARDQAFSMQSKDEFKSLKKFNQLLMK